jgi:hypothetical protein
MVETKTNAVAKPNWVEQKAKLRAKFPKLTDEDVNFEESGKAEMLTKLEVKLAIPASELQIIAEAL